MGSGAWSIASYTSYTNSRGIKTTTDGSIDSSYRVQDLYKQNRLHSLLDPKNVMRECCDSEEHPNTIPVILALDVTGSMGHSAEVAAQKLNTIMTKLYDQVKDVEFLIMGIGDFACDDVPMQASQFESDIRIADQLEKVYFEFGGGGNSYESYTGAWYFGARHTKLDCWKRGKKGIIITLGDEPLNPYLPKRRLTEVTGDDLQADINTSDLYEEASNKYNIYHIAISDTHTYSRYQNEIRASYGNYLDDNHLIISSCENLPQTIINIVTNEVNHTTETIEFTNSDSKVNVTELNEISW